MALRFNESEWQNIFSELNQHSKNDQPYGMPQRRDHSVVISSFNIRSLGNPDSRTLDHEEGRTDGAWDLLARYVSQCDFVAIQEVRDNLEGLIRLKDSLEDSDKYALVVSDVTGANIGEDKSQERLAFLYRWDRIERTELASDLSYDRRSIFQTLEDNCDGFAENLMNYSAELSNYKLELRDYQNNPQLDKPKKPKFKAPAFLTFIRTPHVASFQIKGRQTAAPLPFLAINAHLLYGKSPQERADEFDALIEWLSWRTTSEKNLYHKNMILFGDLNLEFEKRFVTQEAADQALKDMNNDVRRGYKVNFPFLDTPKKRQATPLGNGKGRYNTTARMTQTYDHIGFFGLDDALPDYSMNDNAGENGLNGYDYDVFCFADLCAKAIHDEPLFLEMSDQSSFYKRFEYDVSDHHPIWVRLPIPT